MLGEEGEHAALGDQVTDQGGGVEEFPVGAFHTLHADIIPYIYKQVHGRCRVVRCQVGVGGSGSGGWWSPAFGQGSSLPRLGAGVGELLVPSRGAAAPRVSVPPGR